MITPLHLPDAWNTAVQIEPWSAPVGGAGEVRAALGTPVGIDKESE